MKYNLGASVAHTIDEKLEHQAHLDRYPMLQYTMRREGDAWTFELWAEGGCGRCAELARQWMDSFGRTPATPLPDDPYGVRHLDPFEDEPTDAREILAREGRP